MITFGFKNKYSGWIRAAVAIALGIIMIVLRGQGLELIIQIMAAMLLTFAVVVLGYGLVNRDSVSFPMIVSNSVFSLVLGILLFTFPGVVSKVLIVGFGLLLFVIGIFHILIVSTAFSRLPLKGWNLIMPILCIAGGVLLVFQPKFVQDAAGLFAGIFIAIYGINEFIATVQMTRIQNEDKKKEDVPADDFKDAVDVEYTKVDEASDGQARLTDALSFYNDDDDEDEV